MSGERTVDDVVGCQLGAAVAAHQQGDLPTAIAAYDAVLELDPGNASALQFGGVALYQSGVYEKARDYLQHALEACPGDCEIPSNLGLAHIALGDVDAAIRCYRQALEINPRFANALNNLANAYIAADDRERAKEVLRELITLQPDHPEACNNLGVLLSRHGDAGEARRLFEAALQKRPKYVDALVNYGRHLMRQDSFDAAVELFERAAAAGSDDVTIYRDLGSSLQELGRHTDAVEAYRRALAVDGGNAEMQTALGNAYQQSGEPGEAAEHYREALEIDPSQVRAINNLGTLAMQEGRKEEALDCFESALKIDDTFVEATFNKASALQDLGNYPLAAKFFHRAIDLRPGLSRAYRYLSEIYRVSGLQNEQSQVLREWLQQEPDSALAKHLLAAAEQSSLPERASDDFVREEFDDFADSFDKTLERLNYQTPQLLADLLASKLGPGASDDLVLDAGCGTGLCGPLLRPRARQLIGVDLSPNMLAEARKRMVYDELCGEELVRYLQARQAAFDLIVSADTLVYFGPLQDVCEAAAQALRPAGAFAFSLEKLEDEGAQRFRLNPSGRYSHSRAYVESCLRGAGFVIDALEEGVLRTEMQNDVAGLIVLGHRE